MSDDAPASTTWNNKLHSVSWRVDVASKSRHTPEVNKGLAIVEMGFGEGPVRQKRKSLS